MTIRRLVTLLVTSILLLGGAQAQMSLNEFEEGTPIVADEVNENFQNLADALEDTNARVDALDTGPSGGATWVTREDLVPAEGILGEYEYSPAGNKAELVLTGDSLSAPGGACFRGRVELPDGATITEFGAIARAPSGQTPDAVAEVFLLSRAWADESFDALATVYGGGSDYGETSTTAGALPAGIDADAKGYFVGVCLTGKGGFLSARVSYDLP